MTHATIQLPDSDRATIALRATSAAVVDLSRAVLAQLDVSTDRLVEIVVREDPSYGQGRTPREDLRRSCHDNLQRILEWLTGTTDPASDPFDAPRATGRRRAEQGMPLESVLHAYRLGFTVIWQGLTAEARLRGPEGIDGLVEAASEVWMLVDEFSSQVAGAYRVAEAELTRRDGRRRDAFVDALLDGRGGERAVAADAASALDLPEHGRFAVVVVAGADGGSIADARLSAVGLRAVWRSRTDREIGLVPLGRSTVADILGALEPEGGLRAGISPVVELLADVDRAYRLAETALRALPLDAPGVAELDAQLPGALLVTAPDLAARLVHRALGGILDLEPEERALLLSTLRAWLAEGGSAGQTAARLYCHRNTVLNRLRRIEGLTGRSALRVDHLVEWSLALLALDVLPDTRAPADTRTPA